MIFSLSMRLFFLGNFGDYVSVVLSTATHSIRKCNSGVSLLDLLCSGRLEVDIELQCWTFFFSFAYIAFGSYIDWSLFPLLRTDLIIRLTCILNIKIRFFPGWMQRKQELSPSFIWHSTGKDCCFDVCWWWFEARKLFPLNPHLNHTRNLCHITFQVNITAKWLEMMSTHTPTKSHEKQRIFSMEWMRASKQVARQNYYRQFAIRLN